MNVASSGTGNRHHCREKGHHRCSPCSRQAKREEEAPHKDPVKDCRRRCRGHEKTSGMFRCTVLTGVSYNYLWQWKGVRGFAECRPWGKSLLCTSVCSMGAWNEREAERSCSLLHPERRGYDSSKRGRCVARGGLDQYGATKDSRLPNASGVLRCRLGNSSYISFYSVTRYYPIWYCDLGLIFERNFFDWVFYI